MRRKLLLERLIQQGGEGLFEIGRHGRLNFASLVQTLELLVWFQLLGRVRGVFESAAGAVNRLQMRYHFGPKLLLLRFEQALGARFVGGRQMAHVSVEALASQYVVENHQPSELSQRVVV